MTKELDPIEAAAQRQAEIVAAQEAEQSVPPTPTQEELDAARLGVGKPAVGAKAAVAETAEAPAAKAVAKHENAETAGTYKTRASKAN